LLRYSRTLVHTIMLAGC